MALRLPPLTTLRIFEAAARLQSFKLAAGELGLTPSAISHGVVTLETWLATELFRRGGRQITLTQTGQQFIPYVSEGLSMIAVGAQRISAGLAEHRVSISVAPTFAARWLLPRLKRFRELHPQISVAVDTSHRQALFPLDGVDLAIRMGKGPWPGTRSELLMRERLVPIAAPEYLRALKRRGGSIDWARATLLRISSVEHDWETWLTAAGVAPPETIASLSFDTVQLAVDAAAEGLGIAIGREPLIAGEIASRRVVPASDLAVEIDTGYWLTGAAGEETRREIRALHRWILSEARGEGR
ncbi:DNA-binding transcriptional regulator, LysR family [Rhizobiales bacterium GAS191]|nr:DNA-binding transcriptional regulator, LysR family [Rhizobiales bacterium GAS191]